MVIRTAFASFLAAAALAGCYRPHGPMMNYPGAPHTYFSTETQPKSITLTDLRTQEVVFAMDIPVGKQLTIQFIDQKGDDPVYTPDLLMYQVFDMGTETGKLRNAMSVPDSASRRLAVTLRPGPEYVNAAPEELLRTDQLIDRPDWWTPKGGEMPEDPLGLHNYDG